MTSSSYDIYGNKLDYIYKVGRAINTLSNEVDKLETNVNNNNKEAEKYDSIEQICNTLNNTIETFENDVNSTIDKYKEFNTITKNVITSIHSNINMMTYLKTIVEITIYYRYDGGEDPGFTEFGRKLYIQEFNAIYIDALEYFFNDRDKIVITKYRASIDQADKTHTDGDTTDFIVATPGTTEIYLTLKAPEP